MLRGWLVCNRQAYHESGNGAIALILSPTLTAVASAAISQRATACVAIVQPTLA